MSPHPLLPDWRDLCRLPDAALAKLDVAVVNLACSAGLPGAEAIDVSGCLRTIDNWAVGVRKVTEHRLRTEFHGHEEKFDFSEPLFRMVKLVFTLQNHCGVKYDRSKIGATPDDPFDFHEHFVHGPIQGPGGTCATLPVLYAAVGRRLGYPVRLVKTREHMFCRWDDPVTGERVNIEATGNGVTPHPDDHYRTWPYPITPREEAGCRFLKSLTPREELADFVSRRAVHWRELGNDRRAMAARVAAALVVPEVEGWWGNVVEAEAKWEAKLRARCPPGFPKVEIVTHPDRRRWPELRWEAERRLRLLEAVENVLNDPDLESACWAPLRAGEPPKRPLPGKIVVDCTAEHLCTPRP